VHWSAIIFNGSGEFAVLAKPDGQHLPSGEIGPRTVIANECIAAVGLDRANFSPGQPFHLLDVYGRGGRGFTLYFSGQIVGDDDAAKQFAKRVVFLPQSALGSFVPPEVEDALKHVPHPPS